MKLKCIYGISSEPQGISCVVSPHYFLTFYNSILISLTLNITLYSPTVLKLWLIRMRGCSFFFLLFLQFSLSTRFLVDPEKNRIIDGYGRERIFHGENVVMKTIPFVPITSHFDAR